jgi:hypothetical protein
MGALPWCERIEVRGAVTNVNALKAHNKINDPNHEQIYYFANIIKMEPSPFYRERVP